MITLKVAMCVYLLVGMVFAVFEIMSYRKDVQFIQDSVEEMEDEEVDASMFTPSFIEELIISSRVTLAWPTYILETILWRGKSI